MSQRKVGTALVVVGTIAALAVYSSGEASQGTFLAGDIRDIMHRDIDGQWADFMATHNRQFMTVEEFQARKKNFAANLATIRANKPDSGVQLDLNQFGDWSLEQFQSLLGFKGDSTNLTEETTDSEAGKGRGLQSYPTSLNWISKGAVTAVKNQGSCGSCYTFASAAALEGAYQIKTGSLVDFSEQQLLDCTGPYGNNGCSGGLMTNTFNYLKSHYQQLESTYPYVAYKTACQYSGSGPTFVKSYTNVGASYNSLLAAIQLGPVALAIDANNYTFMFYKGGIIAGGCGTSLNHAVTLVGYGTSAAGNAYWLIKNSWGTGWGEGGYFRLYRTTSYPGVCGILMMNSYPTV